MTVWKLGLAAGAALQLLVLTGCNSYRVIPAEFEGRVNKNVSYGEANSHPSSHVGQLVIWGGEVLRATRTPDETRLEVLQLPLNDDYVPAGERVDSSGRFHAIDAQGKIIDPAVLPEGSRVTIIGEVKPPVTASLETDRSETIPVIHIRDMTLWDKQVSRAWPYYPSYGPYYGHYYYGARPYVFWDGTRVPGS